MKIIFEKLKFKNFLSYGNSATEFDLTFPGMTWISGRSGAGKSVIINALSFALFGKPVRDVTISELVNRTNKKNTLAEVWFTVNDTKYYIKRGIKPDILEIHKNGSAVELRSSKKLIQEDIEKIIGVSHIIFKNAISLALSHNTPFLVMTAAEKRKTIEEMFGISVFALISKSVKSDMAQVKMECQLLDNNISNNKSTIETLTEQQTSFDKMSLEFEEIKKTKILQRETHIKNLAEKCKAIEETAKVLIEEYNNTNILKIDNSGVGEMNIEVGTLRASIKSQLSKVDFYSKNNVCPTCEQTLEHEKCGVNLDEMTANIKLDIAKVKNIEAEIIQINKNYANMQTEIKALEVLKNKILDLKTKVSDGKKEMKSVYLDIERIKNEELNLDVSALTNKLDILKTDGIAFKKKNKDLVQKQGDLSIISKIVADDGVKRFFLEQIAPTLSAKCNYYIDKFDLYVSINIDSKFECCITDVISGSEITYKAFSEGEKKRIDIAILLSIIDTMKLVKNWDCNIIFFDELFDNALDIDNLTAIFKVLTDIIKSNTDMGMYLISHRIADALKYNRKIDLLKSEGFSEVKITTGNITEEYFG